MMIYSPNMTYQYKQYDVKNKWNKENKIEKKKKRTSNLGLKQRRARGGGDWGEMEMRIYWDYLRGFIPKKKLPTNQPTD